MSTIISPPNWLKSVYSTFPLKTLQQEDSIPSSSTTRPSLWITPSSSSSAWASSDPECLRVQLLFLFRGQHVSFRDWPNAASAPNGKLPALYLPSQNALLSSDEIRSWLDEKSPLDALNGMPNEAAYEKAVAVAQLVLGRLRPQSGAEDTAAFPKPPPLSAGLVTPLPASLTGDARTIDHEVLKYQADQAWTALDDLIGDKWALDASHPTPLDALITAYAFTSNLGEDGYDTLKSYTERVMDHAEAILLRLSR